jgi:hypothetical protein
VVPGRGIGGGGNCSLETKTADLEDLDDVKRVKKTWEEVLTTRQGIEQWRIGHDSRLAQLWQRMTARGGDGVGRDGGMSLAHGEGPFGDGKMTSTDGRPLPDRTTNPTIHIHASAVT